MMHRVDPSTTTRSPPPLERAEEPCSMKFLFKLGVLALAATTASRSPVTAAAMGSAEDRRSRGARRLAGTLLTHGPMGTAKRANDRVAKYSKSVPLLRPLTRVCDKVLHRVHFRLD